MIADVRWPRFTWLLWMLVLVVPLGACGGKAVGDPDQDTNQGKAASLESIAISPATISVMMNATVQFEVTGAYSDHQSKAVTEGITWTTSRTEVATISPSGLATGAGPGATTITAKVGSKTATATMNVRGSIDLVSIQVTPPTASIGGGVPFSFTATAMYNDGSSEDVTSSATWASSDTSVATIAAGVATGVESGTTKISALSDGQIGSAVLTVVYDHAIALAVAPATVTLSAGQAQQFTATIEFNGGTTQDVTNQATWTSDDEAVVSVDAQGLVTGLEPGDTTIRATFMGLTGMTDVTVAHTDLVEVIVSPDTAFLGVGWGSGMHFTAEALYTDGSSSDVTNTATWTSSDTEVATIDANGAPTALAGGTTMITAEFDGVYGTATLIVGNDPILLSVTVTPSTATIAPGTTQQFTATSIYSDGTTADVTSSVNWTSSAPTTATVDAFGLAAGVAMGNANITAVLGSVQGSASLTVGPL